jgi:hypothetical protein
MRRTWAGIILALALCATAATARAQSDDKEDCKRRCEDEMRECKGGCQQVRDSGTYQESALYRQCDAGCHDTRDICRRDCEQGD